jgi:hypothetical protein
MTLENILLSAEHSARVAVLRLGYLRGLTDDARLMTSLFPDLIAFYVDFSPLNEGWRLPIEGALPLVRGVRTDKGVRIGPYRANCHHEILLKVVKGLHDWLGGQDVFQPIAQYLCGACLDLFGLEGVWWERAVRRFILARCATDRQRERATRQAEHPMYQEPRFGACEAIYRRLVSEESVDAKTFTQVVQASPASAYRRLGKELGQRASAYDLGELLRQIEWEASRALLVNHDALLGDGPRRIRPEDRTRPMTLQEASRFSGHAKGKSTKQGVKDLRAAIDGGLIDCESLTRQQHVFNRRQFPKEAWPRITPTGPK